MQRRSSEREEKSGLASIPTLRQSVHLTNTTIQNLKSAEREEKLVMEHLEKKRKEKKKIYIKIDNYADVDSILKP
jgi:hypothetical protein